MACSDFLQADKGKGNHIFPWPPAVSFLLLCLVSWNGDEFSCNTQSPEEHFSLHVQLSFSRGLRRQNDLPPMQSWPCQDTSMARHCLMELCSNFQHGLLCPSQSGPVDLSGFLLGRKECGVSHFIMMSCSFVPWCLCSRCSLHLGNLPLLGLLGELTFLLQGSAYMQVPDCGLLHCAPTPTQS